MMHLKLYYLYYHRAAHIIVAETEEQAIEISGEKLKSAITEYIREDFMIFEDGRGFWIDEYISQNNYPHKVGIMFTVFFEYESGIHMLNRYEIEKLTGCYRDAHTSTQVLQAYVCNELVERGFIRHKFMEQVISWVENLESLETNTFYNYKITHQYSRPNNEIYIRSSIDPLSFWLLCYYFQDIASDIAEGYDLEETEIQDLLKEYFNSHGINRAQRRRFQRENPYGLDYFTIDLYLNWEATCSFHEKIRAIDFFSREGVYERIKEQQMKKVHEYKMEQLETTGA